MELRWPDMALLEHYVAALERGWQPSAGNPVSQIKEIEDIKSDPAAFLAKQVDIEGTGPPVVLPDGSTVPRIPGYRKWIWDGEFCGGISFRWMPHGTEALPPHVLGHIGYGVVPWKRRQGYATRAVRMILPEAAARGFDYVELTTDEDNLASRGVIEAAGGYLFERFTMPESHGGGPARRYRIDLAAVTAAATEPLVEPS